MTKPVTQPRPQAKPVTQPRPQAKPVGYVPLAKTKYKPSEAILRPGALDYRRHPSVINGQRVAYTPGM